MQKPVLFEKIERRNITSEREALHEALDHFEHEGLGGGSKDYLSGLVEPNMADIAVYGTLSSIRGLEAHDDAISKRGGAIQDWYQSIQAKME